MNSAALDDLIQQLEAIGDYRVLRRFNPADRIDLSQDRDLPTGAFVDCETTGLDPEIDEIIELAVQPFTYDPKTGIIYRMLPAFEGLREPGRPISAEIMAVHGITNAMVRGKSIDPSVVTEYIAGAAPIISHHAKFDRPFAEKLVPEFATRPWACSMEQVPWRENGYESSGLPYLALANGFFYDKHRALVDCQAALHLLERSLPRTGKPALLALLDNGRKSAWRIWAEGSPFPKKDILKGRGYQWNSPRKCWYVDTTDAETELAYLSAEIYGCPVDLPIYKITAYERFSVRAS